MQINVKKTYLLVRDNDKKRREQEPVPLLTINGETLQAMNLDDADIGARETAICFLHIDLHSTPNGTVKWDDAS